MNAQNPEPHGPLSGLLVADFSRVLAGPYCTMLLADMGATVIKVESPAGDDTRQWTPPVRDEEATYYLSVNRNKRSLTLDLGTKSDQLTALALARNADVLIENFKPGGMAAFGLDYDSVAAINPGVVYASITGFGASSPLPGYDILAQALSGLMSITGSADGEPTKAGVAIIDVVTGLHAGLGALAALRHRDITGRGQHIEVNLLSSALSALVNQSAAFALGDTVPRRMGNDHPSIYPYGPFATAAGDLVIAVGNDAQFGRLAEILEIPGVASDTRFVTARARSANREELRPVLQVALSCRTAVAWFDALSAASVPCAPILDIGEAFAWAESLGLQPLVETGSGERIMPGVRHPIRFSETPAEYPLAPPRLGADTAWAHRLLETIAGTPQKQDAAALAAREERIA
ncbi:CaiB/BaiF CoA transferase family protein [Microbacterium aurantiacum]|uniref:CaiB/BaiF CoA transferase family protein n=1 Tax=Microbacterium aurantiacum TaxID=162393 RepID=UPI003447D748